MEIGISYLVRKSFNIICINRINFSMANVKGSVSEDLQNFIPNVCTNSPASGQAFCKEHTEIISCLGYPTELRKFLKSCAVDDGEEIDPENYTKSMQKKVDEVLIKICNKIPASAQFKSCIDAQGGTSCKKLL